MCTAKRFINQNGKIIQRNFQTNKFEITQTKVNVINIIKQYLN